MGKTKVDWRIPITAIVAIMLLEAIALYKGINGVLLTTVIAVIAGIAGWTAPQLKIK